MHRRIGGGLVVAVSPVVIAVVVLTRQLSVAPQPSVTGYAQKDQQHAPPALPSDAETIHTGLDPVDGRLQVSSDADQNRTSAVDPASGTTIQATSPRSSNGDEQTLMEASTGAKGSDAGSIGRPFPLSQSIRDQCDQFLRQGPNSICDGLFRALLAMAEEPVDSRWAPAIEAQLRAKITEAGQYTIRSVECRTTKCAIELVSPDGDFLAYRLVVNDEALNKQLRAGPAATTHESHKLVIAWYEERR